MFPPWWTNSARTLSTSLDAATRRAASGERRLQRLVSGHGPATDATTLGSHLGDEANRLAMVETQLRTAETTEQDTNTRVRALEDRMAEVKELLARALDRERALLHLSTGHAPGRATRTAPSRQRPSPHVPE